MTRETIRTAHLLTLALGVAGVACAEETIVGVGGSVACDGLDESSCAFPFPSDYFRDRSQGRLRFFAGSLPIDAEGRRVAPDAFNRRDGFSVVTPISFRLEGATLAGAPSSAAPEQSLAPDAKTIILDASSGRRVAHGAELDAFSEDGGAPTIALRLAEALDFERRYIVAVRGLVDANGAPVPPERGFRALRDGRGEAPVGVAERLDRFEAEVFPPLAAAGVARSELILAFDFTTGSEADPTRTLLAMRRRFLEAIGPEGPAYTVNQVEDEAEGPIARVVRGVLHVPSFLEPARDGPRRLRFDAQGEPELTGTEDLAFDLQIPRSALTSSAPFSLLQYGHGLLGSRAEAYNPWLRDLAERRRALVVAIDMTGMSEDDAGVWIETLAGDPSNLPAIAEPIHQGVLNHLALTRALRGRFARDPDPRFTRSGAPLYDPSRVAYYGNSQGGTMGGVILTLSDDLERGVLGVPGGAFSFLLTRSSAFAGYATLVQALFPSATDFLVLMGLVQTAFDPIDPMNYVHRLHEGHAALLHVAREDAQVNNQVSHLLARRAGARLVTPPSRPIWGLLAVPAPASGTTLVEYDFGRPENPRPNRPADADRDTHGELRRSVCAQDQLMGFLATGLVEITCVP